MTTTPTQPAPVSQRLKEGTWDLHSAAEKQPFQQNLVKGAVTKEAYGAWLAQMQLIHAALEEGLRELAAADPRVAAVVTNEQYQTPYLHDDLAALAASPAAEALAPVAAIVGEIETAREEEPLRLLGFHYVLEGSNNGNAFIARALRPALGMTPGQGDRYLDPYGDRQRAVWGAFRVSIDAQPFTDAEQQTLISAARTMFQSVHDLSAALPSD